MLKKAESSKRQKNKFRRIKPDRDGNEKEPNALYGRGHVLDNMPYIIMYIKSDYIKSDRMPGHDRVLANNVLAAPVDMTRLFGFAARL